MPAAVRALEMVHLAQLQPDGQDDRSRVTGDCHARICGSRGVRLPPATRLLASIGLASVSLVAIYKWQPPRRSTLHSNRPRRALHQSKLPSLLAAASALKLALTRRTYAEKPEGWSRELVIGHSRLSTPHSCCSPPDRRSSSGRSSSTRRPASCSS
jgi:hypothetical protein